MANFYIRSTSQVIPIEEITFTDTNQKAKGIHSTIDKVFFVSREKLIGTVATNIKLYEFDFGDETFGKEKTFRALTSITQPITFLFAEFIEDTDEEGCYIKVGSSSLSAEYIASFNAGQIGAYILLSDCNLATDHVFIGTSGAYSGKTLRLVVGLQP